MARSKNESTVVEEETEKKQEIHVAKSKKELLEEKLRPHIEKETRLVKGRFKNYECPGGGAHIHCSKFPGVKPFSMEMVDDHVYEIPLYAAHFLNGIDETAPCKRIDTCSYAISGYKWLDGKPPDGTRDDKNMIVPVVHTAKRVRRYGFESLQFDTDM
jgi:hypothetical protein